MRPIQNILGSVIFWGLSTTINLQAQTSIDLQINLPEVLIADAGPDQEIEPGTSAILGGATPATGGTGDYIYIWTPSESLNDPYVNNPVASPSTTTTFTLSIIDERKCVATDEIRIKVNVTGLEDYLDPSNCLVFPNPSTGIFNLRFIQTDNSKTVAVRVFNSLGKAVYINKLYHGLPEDTHMMDLKDEPPGIYLLEVSVEKSKAMFKLIIE